MRFKRLILPFAIASVFSLASCSLMVKPDFGTTTTKEKAPGTTGTYTVPNPDNTNGLTVTYVLGNGNTICANATDTKKILKPEDPVKLCASFMGWYTDKEYTKEFDFSSTISSSITLYAKWEIDYISLYNEISNSVMKSNMRILVENYDIQGFGRKTNTSSSLGSGVIFYEDTKYYYVLTNNHVIYTKTQYQELVVEDVYENEYDATIVGKSNNYDLAILKFAKPDIELNVIKVSDYEVPTDEVVFSLGEPDGLSNAVLGGKITGVKTFTPDEDTKDISNITFSVYTHSCPIMSGSSGGMLVDSNLNLVGINFASSVSKSEGTFRYAYAIPIAKVKEFISLFMTIEI